MEHDFKSFHRIIDDLLKDIGFESAILADKQEVISIEIEKRFMINFGLIDHISWFILAEIMQTEPDINVNNYSFWLRNNQMNLSECQPIIALDENNKLVCWRKLPLYGCDRSQTIFTFNTILDTAQRLLQ